VTERGEGGGGGVFWAYELWGEIEEG